MNYNPNANDEAGRIAALYRYEILDTPPAPEFEGVTELVKSIFKVPMVAITFIDKNRQWFLSRQGIDAVETPRSTSFCDYTIRQQDVLRIEDATADPRFSANPLVAGSPSIRSYMGAPLTTPDGYNIGAICAIDTEPRVFSDADASVLANFARLVVSQLELHMIASEDSLTAAATRRAFKRAMVAEIERFNRHQVPVSLVTFDLDHFKLVNDRFGHDAGDAVLSAAAKAVDAVLRQNDLIGRLGGEEFGVLLCNADASAARQAAERMRAGIKALRFAAYPDLRVTASFGVMPYGNHFASPDEWLAAADHLLYAAKAGGRDRCIGVSSEEAADTEG